MHISEYLKINELSQAGFGLKIGVSQAAVERYANGRRIPTPSIMTRIISATNGEVTANDFYGVAPPETPPQRNPRKRKVSANG